MFNKTAMSSQELASATGSLPIHESLALRAWAHPEKVLFTFLDDNGDEQSSLTYRHLMLKVNSIRKQLLSLSQPGDRVALFFPQGLEFIASFLACLASGRIAVPINLPTRRRVERCVSILDDSGTSLALVAASERAALQQAFAETPVAALQMHEPVAQDDTQDDWLPVPDTDPAQIAFLQYTSGSTSAPKGVMVSHANITANLRMMRDSWELDCNSDFVTWQPHHHDMGLILGQLLPIVLGNHTVILSPSTFVRQPLIWLQAISRYKATLAGGPNFAYNLAAERYCPERLKDLDLSSWTHALNGADVVRAASLARFSEKYVRHGFSPNAFLPCYGLAEATLFVTGGPFRRPVSYLAIDPDVLAAQRKAVSPHDSSGAVILTGCGEPSWEVEVAIVDPDTHQRCTAGSVGEIWLNGPAIAGGYWRNSTATNASFRAVISSEPGREYLRTGDLGFLGQKDKQLFICGRLKDLIVCEGRNVHPEDIEDTVIECLHEARPQSCAVFSYEDDQQRQHIVAVVELNRELKRLLADDARKIKVAVRAAVAEHHGVPLSRLTFVLPTSMHKTTSGKIQRKKMRELYLAAELEGMHELA